MCGICGYYGIDDGKLIKQMNSFLVHRGPDEFGFLKDKNMALGHRRLSIIDLKGGKQPISNEEGNIWVVFNGEIYNYKTIRTELEKKGHKFKTSSDTEVLVHSYEEWGDKFISKLNGCFGFAIWDGKNQRFLLARDRHGIKPLFYTLQNKKFLFASEAKAILAYKEIKKEVNPTALHDFLSFRCNSLAETMFKRIFKLLPGQYLTYDTKKDNLKTNIYWKANVKIDKSLTEKQYTDLMYKKIKDAVEMRLMSEVPLGAYLSGGVDSGSIVGLMSKMTDEPVKTFSVGFGFADEHDELKKARFLANHFKTEHREIIVKPDTIGILPKIVWHLDEPMSDPTCIPVYLLSQKVKKYVTVILTGDGGDENFGGYEQFKLMNTYNRLLKPIPKILRTPLPHMVGAVPPDILNIIFKYAKSLGKEGIKRFGRFATTNNPAEAYLNLVSIFSEEEKKELYSEILRKTNKDINYYTSFRKYFQNKKAGFLNNIMYMDTEKILAENMLMKGDKMTMAWGVEARVPLLDPEVSDLIAKVPPHLKIKGKNDKILLRKAMSRVIPKQTAQRKKDRFFVPIDRWFEGELKEITKQALSKETIIKQGYFNYPAIEKIYRNYSSSKLFSSRQLWALLSFQIWHKIFIENDNINFNKASPDILGSF